jgi:hypothetical protein
MSHSSAAAGQGSGGQTGRGHRAGAFDVRNFIGMLLGIYGIILVLAGLFSSDGRGVNLWAGVGMVVAAAVFLGWARLRPVVVPDDPADGEVDDAPARGSH